MFADIIVDITLEKLNHSFQYAIPEELEGRVGLGSQVVIPFGNRKMTGIVIGLSSEPKLDISKIKPIKSVSNEAAPYSDLISLAAWMSDYFGSTMNQALKTTLPLKKKAKPKERKIVCLKADRDEVLNYLSKLVSRKNHSLGKERLLKEILEDEEIPWDVLIEKLHVTSENIRSLEKDGIVEIKKTRVFRGGIKNADTEKVKVELNLSQKAALDEFLYNRSEGIHKPYLLYGVTGSGKTEVYMEMIADTIEKGQQAIVLIPEIALTFQTVMRFYKRFGEIVSFVNSRMSDGEKQDQMDRAIAGDCKIMIGPRSALFTPFKDLGLIIVDEEHETSYKSENAPRYHAVRTAIERAKICGADIVLGSATPSVETFYNAEVENYTLLKLPERAKEAEMPEAEIIDLRQELRSGNKSMFSRRLTELIKDRLDNGEQVMLFLNRRGMMGAVSCRMCGKTIKCPHCDVPMSLHRDGLLHCHYCGTKIKRPKGCPSCGSNLIGTMKAGTEMVEEKLSKLFPEAKILRMDADTTKDKGAHEAILSAFANHEADILVGTQMIVKGHDFSNVTLMGVLAADMSLNASDFRAAERTYDLLVQAAGRAGRGERPGTVIIQTYQPDHFVIESSAKQSYEDFYRDEVVYRKMGKYPPFGHLLKILIESRNKNRIEEFSERLAEVVRSRLADMEGFERTKVLGPEDDYPPKINDVYRKTLYLKDADYDRLIAVKKLISKEFPNVAYSNSVNIWFDYDPL